MKRLGNLTTAVVVSLLGASILACAGQTNSPAEPDSLGQGEPSALSSATSPAPIVTPVPLAASAQAADEQSATSPAAAPANSAVPTAVPTSTPLPTATRLPTSTPDPPTPEPPTPTPTYVPTLTPAPTSPLQALGLDFPWAQGNELNLNESAALDILNLISQKYPSVFAVVPSVSWLADGVDAQEINAMLALFQIIDRFPPGDTSLAQVFSETPWLLDDITSSELSYLNNVARTIKDPATIIEDIRQTTFDQTTFDQTSSQAPPEAQPRPALGPLVTISDLTWAKDGLSELEQKALADLQTFERDYPEMADLILRYPWVSDGIAEDEQLALGHLLAITQGGSLAKLLGSSLPPHAYQDIVDRMPGHYYLMDGITPTERLFLRDISEIPEQSTMIASFISSEPIESYAAATPAPAPTPTPSPAGGGLNFPWAQDGLTAVEQEAMGYLQDLQSRDEYVAGEVLKAPWLLDGIDEGERRLLCHIATNPETGTALAIFLSTVPSETLPACP